MDRQKFGQRRAIKFCVKLGESATVTYEKLQRACGEHSVVPPTEPCAPKSTQPLKVGTRDFSWGKGGRCVWLTTYHPCSAERQESPGP